MYINVGNYHGEISLTPAQFSEFANLCATGQKIQAIKFVRDTFQTWSLKEAKDFVEACDFPPVPVTTTLPPFDTTENFLSDLKSDLREIILAGKDYRDSLLIDLFGRISGKLGPRYYV